jgi:hypothetical protein
MSFTILSLYSFIGQYMFRPNRPSSGVQIVLDNDSAAHCNAEERKPHYRAVESLITTCTPEDGQLGWNMKCPIKEYKERTVNDIVCRQHKSSESQIFSR